MDQSNRKRNTLGLFFDWPFIIRILCGWLPMILSLAATLAIGAYIVLDQRSQETCTVSAIVAVVPREYNTTNLSNSTNDSALARNCSMWNSKSMLKVIADLDENIVPNGYLRAHPINGSNLVEVKVSADTAQDAFYLLNGAICNYRKIVSNFDETHFTIVLTDVVKNPVLIEKGSPMMMVLLVFAGVICGGFGLLGLWTVLTNLLHGMDQANDLLEVEIYESLPKVHKKRKEPALLLTKQNLSFSYSTAMERCAARLGHNLDAQNKKTLMITSVREKEGKATFAVNLSICLAKKGYQTLLIDMDLRNPSIYRMLSQGKEETRTTEMGLKKDAFLSDCIIHREDLGTLDVIFQFQPVSDADRYLETADFAEQLKNLANHYDYVIINTAPMGPVRDADVVAQRVDASFLVLRQEYDQAPIVNEIIDQLNDFGAQCMGAVMSHCKTIKRRPFVRNGDFRRKNYYGKEGRA